MLRSGRGAGCYVTLLPARPHFIRSSRYPAGFPQAGPWHRIGRWWSSRDLGSDKGNELSDWPWPLSHSPNLPTRESGTLQTQPQFFMVLTGRAVPRRNDIIEMPIPSAATGKGYCCQRGIHRYKEVHAHQGKSPSPIRQAHILLIIKRDKIPSVELFVSSFFASSTSREAKPCWLQPLSPIHTYNFNFYIPVNFRDSQLPTVSNNNSNNPQITPSTPGPESISPSTILPIIKGPASTAGWRHCQIRLEYTQL